MYSRLLLMLSMLVFLLWITGCPGQNKGENREIIIDGSTTMYDLSTKWAEAFMKENPGFTVKVLKSGTSQGIEAFINGRIDIAETSRRLTAEEVLKARKNNVRVEEYYVGFAVYAIVVNPANPVTRLREEELRDIFLGKIKSWKEVGGNEELIEVIYREIPPHEYDFFLEKFVNISQNVSLPPNVKLIPSPPEILKAVQTDKNAIGYLFLQDRGPGVKTLSIAKKGSDEFLQPIISSAGKYPLLRPYFMYISQNYRKPVKQYLRFLYTEEGLELAKKMNFVPVPVKEGEVDRDVLFEYL